MKPGEVNKRLSMAERFAALNRVGVALMSELDEVRLLHLIAETARDITGASFAAFTLRPMSEEGQPLVPSEGHLFRLAAVVGVSKEQEELFRHMALGGEGLLAPIFRQGVSVLVPDALAFVHQKEEELRSIESQETARQAAFDYAHGQLSMEGLQAIGVPRGHPIVRSFLGAPLLDRDKQVLGGLLLGHTEPGQFTQEDEALLLGLAAQAAVALENARLYRAAHMRAQELNAVFESIADGVTVVDHRERILQENTAARRLRASLQARSEGKHLLEKLLHIPARRALNGEIVEGGDAVAVADGQKDVREYLVHASPLQPPKPSSGFLQPHEADSSESVTGAVVVWRDVTEARRLLIERRMHAETEARRALLQLILDQLPSSVYLVRGYDARLVLANHAATTVWGASWPHGLPMRDFLTENKIRIFGVDGHPLALENLTTIRAVQRGETVLHHQEIIRHPDGTTLPVLVNAVGLDVRELYLSPSDVTNQLVEGTEPAAIVVHQDVTALKEAERIKDEFIGIAAHELRSPLAILKGFAQMLLVQTARGKGPTLTDWQVEALQGIDQATLRLVELTEDLLDVTRLQAGRLTLHCEPTDLIALSQRVVRRMQMTTEQHTISLSTAVEHLVVSVDPRRMEQVLINIISNAIKYSPAGGPIAVTIRERDNDGSALITIQDQGIGIPLYQQARIFGRFVRADNVRAYGIGGTGLGLYLCRELIEQQGGRVWFESVEGQGSTFFISLPVVSDE